jgi:hypothetical protein
MEHNNSTVTEVNKQPATLIFLWRCRQAFLPGVHPVSKFKMRIQQFRHFNLNFG